jgi:hypothetical protein
VNKKIVLRYKMKIFVDQVCVTENKALSRRPLVF